MRWLRTATVDALRILFIVNSVASSVTARRRVLIQRALSADHDVVLSETSRRGHAMRLAQSAAQQRFDLVAVLGGDGTLNEAANGLAGSDTALAALPGGSTNVFTRILGLPDDPLAAAAALLAAISEGRIRRIGLGSVEGRYFLSHCGVGFDAAVVEQVERRGPWKRWAGHPLFVWSALDTWIRRVDKRRPSLRVVGQGGADLVSGFYTIVMNANPYTYVGSRPIDVVTDLTLDEPLAAVTIQRLDLSTLASVAGTALRGGDLSGRRHVDLRRNLRSLVIESDPAAPYQVDGDHLGSSKRLHFAWTAERLSLVTPRTSR